MRLLHGLIRPSLLRVALLLALPCLLTGCVSSYLANVAVKAPNRQSVPRAVRDAAYAARFDAVAAQQFRLPVGPPAAELAISVLEPGCYHFSHRLEVRSNDKGHRWLHPVMEWTVPMPEERVPARGTIVVLHGYRDEKEDVMHWAICLAERGYRTVLVDLRGHGRSTGEWIGYGAFESADLAQVIDELQRRGLAGAKVGLLGVSYGASTALLAAARDPRVATVVALEPYSSAKSGVVEFAHGVAPRRAAQLGQGTFDAALRKAPKLAGFTWEQNDVLAAMPLVRVPVLLLHGEKDTWLSPENSRRLLAAAPAGSRLIAVPDDNHLVLAGRLGGIAPDVIAWLDEQVAGIAAPEETAPVAAVAP